MSVSLPTTIADTSSESSDLTNDMYNISTVTAEFTVTSESNSSGNNANDNNSKRFSNYLAYHRSSRFRISECESEPNAIANKGSSHGKIKGDIIGVVSNKALDTNEMQLLQVQINCHTRVCESGCINTLYVCA